MADADKVSTGVAFGASLLFGACAAWKFCQAQSMDRRIPQIMAEVAQTSKSLETLSKQFQDIKSAVTTWAEKQAASESEHAARAEALRDALSGVSENMSNAEFTLDVIKGKVSCAEVRETLQWIAEWHGGDQPLPLAEAYELQRRRLETTPKSPAYAGSRFRKGEPLGVLDEARLMKQESPVGDLKLRLFAVSAKFSVQVRNQWALDRECAQPETLAKSARFSDEKKRSIAEWTKRREDFVAELAANDVFDRKNDDCPVFAEFVKKWESTLNADPKDPAFEKFED